MTMAVLSVRKNRCSWAYYDRPGSPWEGLANLNSAISGNSGHEAGPRLAQQEGHVTTGDQVCG
jgi:hypothetical protein